MRTNVELDDETEEQLETKVCAFLNRWAQHDLIPQFEKVLAQCRQELVPDLRQKLQALRDQAGLNGRTAPQAKAAVDVRKRSSIGTELGLLRLATWDERRLRGIPTEDLATMAFDTSDHLKAEFADRSTFLAYWRSLWAA